MESKFNIVSLHAATGRTWEYGNICFDGVGSSNILWAVKFGGSFCPAEIKNKMFMSIPQRQTLHKNVDGTTGIDPSEERKYKFYCLTDNTIVEPGTSLYRSAMTCMDRDNHKPIAIAILTDDYGFNVDLAFTQVGIESLKQGDLFTISKDFKASAVFMKVDDSPLSAILLSSEDPHVVELGGQVYVNEELPVRIFNCEFLDSKE